VSGRLAFTLPPGRAADAPPEVAGAGRDAVRMLVARRATGALRHAAFGDLPSFLEPGDLVVINTSATVPAAVDALAPTGDRVVVHLSTHLGGDRWAVEVRRPTAGGTEPWGAGAPPSTLALGEGAEVVLIGPHRGGRVWEARVAVPGPVLAWLVGHGRPIRYGYVPEAWPLDAYQTVYATEPGSAEMPSAGRPFTPELVTRLVARGIGVTPVVLHAGVASLEAHEAPYPERVVVPAATAARVDATRAGGGRVVAVGTTVVRALETAADAGGVDGLAPVDGWTDVVVTPERGVRATDGLLTGWHGPEASHLLLLEAVAGRPVLEASYAAAVSAGYRWHEFGDAHLILP
jgi:S-adenosylmethionine:tRNA ribosyltransferase-isomerase